MTPADKYAESSSEGLPTYDTTDKAEKWTKAGPRGSDAVGADNRRFPDADGSRDRQLAVFSSLAGISTLQEIDDAEPELIRDINPQSLLPHRILTAVLHESWHVAKEVLLNAPEGSNRANRRAVMAKLWEYRQWHHQEILAEVMAELNARKRDPAALKPSKGAGSATLSSDIDVNLKGNDTELAVPLFNERFKNSQRLSGHTFTKEPGVVYDVNVYAIDFMHNFSPNVDAGSGRRTTQKEGGREGRASGGIGDGGLQQQDRFEQLVTSLFKARLFMDASEWSHYLALTIRGLPEDHAQEHRDAFALAASRFEGYIAEMTARMEVGLGVIVDRAASGIAQLGAAAQARVPGGAGANHHAIDAARENVTMTAANRIYEDKLAAIHRARAQLTRMIDQLARATPDQKDAIELEIDLELLDLRRTVSAAAVYANEASMTDATIHHGVVGIQGGQEIDQQKSEGVNAVNEHLADVFKEARRYGPGLGAGAYKAGKYLLRLGDAGKNLGFGYISGVQTLYDLGWELSEVIKPQADRGGVDTARASEEAVIATAGITTLDNLLELAMTTAAAIVQEYSQERQAHELVGEDSATSFGHRTGRAKTKNRNVVNQDMVHPIDRASGPESEFLLTEDALAALQAKWSAKR